MIRHVREISEELHPDDKLWSGLVLPAPDSLVVGREVALDERLFQSLAVDRAALDLEIDLDIDIGCADMLARCLAAEKIGC